MMRQLSLSPCTVAELWPHWVQSHDGIACMTGVLQQIDTDFQERQTKKVGKRGCVPRETGAGESSEKGRRRPDNVAALKQNIIIGLVNKLTL